MDEPLLPKDNPENALVVKQPLPFLTEILVLVTLPTGLAFFAETVLASLPILQAILGLGCMLLSGLAAVVLAVGVFLVESRRELLMESRYVWSLCVVSAVSESVLWVLLGIVMTAEVVAPVLAVGFGMQLTLVLLSWQEALPAGSTWYVTAGVGTAQSILVLCGATKGVGWILLGSAGMVVSNVFKATKTQRLAVKRLGQTKEAALCALLLQQRNCKKLFRWVQAGLRRAEANRQE